MPLRTQSSLDVTDDVLREISSEATKLVSEYMATIGERPVRSENYPSKDCRSINCSRNVAR
jgi:hypothetical protein